jgi:hypothetical protein
VYVWTGSSTDEVAPSPKDQAKDGALEQSVAEAEAENVTWRGEEPDAGAAAAEQVTVQGGVTVIVPVLVQVRPLDVAVRAHVYGPGEAYSWTGFFWAEVWPSPKDQA